MTAPSARQRPAHADDLDATLAEAFRRLARGVADRRSAFHTPSIATQGPDGPAIRTMVLRAFDAPARTLRVHTDRRAGKLAALTADRRVAVHIYDAGAQVQVRLQAIAAWHVQDAVARAAWEATPPAARLIYAVTPAPGTPIPGPASATPPADPAAETGAAQFAVVRLVFDRLEWLWLATAGHRRARFLFRDGGWTGAWLVP